MRLKAVEHRVSRSIVRRLTRVLAAGALVAGAGVASLALTGGTAGAQDLVWVQAATPSPGASNASDFLTGVACVSTADCWAVGVSEPGSPDGQTMTLQWDGAQWSEVPSPNPAGSSAMNALRAVACASASECWAVGSMGSGNGGPTATLALEWNGSAWVQVTTPSPGGSTAVDSLTSVTCVSATDCWAVGQANPQPDVAPLVLHWNGTTWSQVLTPTLVGRQGGLEGISCTSSTNCVAVGASFSSGTFSILILDWNGLLWTQATTPPLADTAAPGGLRAVDCVSSADCLAVGTENDNRTALSLQWNGSTWSDVATPDIGGVENYLSSVTCATASACYSVGVHHENHVVGTPTTTRGVLLTWNGSSWQQGATQIAGGSTPFKLDAVTCGSADDCWAVGAVVSGSSGDLRTLAVAGTVPTAGYWEVASDGGLFAYGSAPFYGSMGGKPLNKPVVGMAPTTTGGGYWEVASDGGLFAFGNAKFYGSMGGQPLNKPVVGMAATPTGGGYWEVASDGGLFAFGNAKFYGSMGGQPLNKPVVGMALAPTGGGYWEVASDGGLFAFGNAPFYGSMGGQPLNAPVVAMAATRVVQV